MKAIFLIIGFTLHVSAQAQTNTPVADTANYLVHEIVGKKNQFIGRSFSVLLDSLKISPVELSINLPPADSLKGTKGILEFNLKANFEDAHYLIIEWLNPIPFNTCYPILKNNGFRLTQQVRNLYSSIIIKDIDVKDYSQEGPVKHVIY